MLMEITRYSTPKLVQPALTGKLAWYVACTMPRHEQQVALHLKNREVEPYLPLYSSVRRWKDRRVVLNLPLFPGYVFVRMSPEERLRVLSVSGINRLVSFGGPPVQISDEEMESLRAALELVRAEPHPYLKIGEKVRICNGPFRGSEGIVLRKKDQLRVILSIELLLQAIAIEVDAADIRKLN